MNPPPPTDADFMQEALRMAALGGAAGEVPIGAVLVHEGIVVARGHNTRYASTDLTRHAEIVCLANFGVPADPAFDLSDFTMYSTLEPCAMCAGAILHYRIGRVVYAERDLLLGACGSGYDILTNPAILPPPDAAAAALIQLPEVVHGVGVAESRALLLDFFAKDLGQPTLRWRDIQLPDPPSPPLREG